MKKTVIFSLVLVVVLAGVLAVNYVQASSQNYLKMPSTYTHSFTKAICNENNLCQDYYFVCQDKEVISRSPITGAVVQFPKTWQDPRSKEIIESTC